MNKKTGFTLVQKGQFIALTPEDVIVQVYGVATSRDHCIEFVHGFLKGSLLWGDSFRSSVLPLLKIVIPCTLGADGDELASYFEMNLVKSKGGGGLAADQAWQDFYLSRHQGSILVVTMLFPGEDQERLPLLFAEIVKASVISQVENNPRVYLGCSNKNQQMQELKTLVESVWKSSWKSNITETDSAHTFGFLMARMFEQKMVSKRFSL